MNSSIGEPKRDPFAVLRLKRFRLLISARFFLSLAIQIQGIVLGILVYELTGDPLALGLLGLVEVIPNLVVSLYGGYLSDNFNRKTILQSCIAVLFICGLTILYLTKFHYNADSVVWYYLVIGVTGLARGLFYPSSFAFFTSLIPKELYSNAATWNSTAWHISAVAGPALGGLFYALTDATLPFVLVCVLIGFSFFAYRFVPSPPFEKIENREPIKESLRNGLNFVFSNPIILGVLSLDLFAVLLGGAEALLPLFAKDILHVGKFELGILRASPAMGAILMALVMIYFPPVKNAGRNILLAVGVFGLSIIVFGLSHSYLLSFIALFISGAADNISVVIRTTVIQTYTPDDMRGRVSSVSAMFISSSNELGAFESGVMAKLLGAARSVVIGGFLTLGVVGMMAWKSKVMRRLRMGA
jgi:MFS family permease